MGRNPRRRTAEEHHAGMTENKTNLPSESTPPWIEIIRGITS